MATLSVCITLKVLLIIAPLNKMLAQMAALMVACLQSESTLWIALLASTTNLLKICDLKLQNQPKGGEKKNIELRMLLDTQNSLLSK